MIDLSTGRPRIRRLNSQASARPRATSVATAAITKMAVTRTALCTSASPKARAKFASPFQVKVV